MISFRMKNGMSRKAAADDADMTVDDYVATSVDNYKFMAEHECAAKTPAPRRRSGADHAAPTPAAAPQPPK